MRKLQSQGVHHLAFAVSQATFSQVAERLDERGVRHIDKVHLADAIETLVRRSRGSLSDG